MLYSQDEIQYWHHFDFDYSIIKSCYAKDWSACAELDDCSFHLTAVENPGAINLRSLIIGKYEPAFMDEGKSDHIQGVRNSLKSRTASLKSLLKSQISADL